MAPVLRGVEDELKVRARGVAEESTATEVQRKVQTWTEARIGKKKNFKRRRSSGRYHAQRLWARVQNGVAPHEF